MTVTLKFQSTGMVPGDGRPALMQGGNLTVGRGPSNNLVLPDPEKTLSKNHFVIEDQGGNVVVVDLSTNGTFLNYSKIPLGPTPTPLNNGDVLIAGGYEMVVEIVTGPSFEDMIAPPVDMGAVSHGQAQQAPDPLALLDDAGPGGDFLDDLLGAEGGPQGPGQIQIPDPMDELLPPIEDDDPFFQQPQDGREGAGASDQAHNPSVSDSFAAPSANSANLIPDDWEDDLLSPATTPEAPSASPAAPAEATVPPAGQIPPDDSWNEGLDETPQGHLQESQSDVPGSDPLDALLGDAPIESPSAGASDATASSPVKPRPGSAIPPAEPAAPPLSEAITILPDMPARTGNPNTDRSPAGDGASGDRMPDAPVPVATVPAAPSGSGAATQHARAFLAALDVPDLDIADADLGESMTRLGKVMRSMISGLREILMTRTSIKSEFRIDQTMISAGGNNPLKFSVSPEQAIEALVKPRSHGYLGAEEATQEALNDIKAHEVAMVTGMEAALKGVLQKLDPDVLSGQIESAGKMGGLLKGKKARYWEVYEKMYADISDQAENDFHELFSREFARAYKEQLGKLK